MGEHYLQYSDTERGRGSGEERREDEKIQNENK